MLLAEKFFLVNFGAVTDACNCAAIKSSTIIGTLGYMAPEQSLGKANLSTDLYGLGATLLFLLTRKSPSQCYRYSIKVSSLNRIRGGLRLVHFIEKTLELKIKNRFESASAALLDLNSMYNLKTFQSLENLTLKTLR
ncbi:hypothetical protein QM565_34765 [Geitlerinema splendidum]|nr:hypothetical protein [Geitlerinema splendidum]